MTRRASAALVAGLAAVVAVPSATGHPGHGPGTVDIADFKFTPRKLTVAEGDTVIWFWTGPDTNHSVTADPGQAEEFDSDAGRAAPLVDHDRGDTFSHVFRRIGTYTYFCKVHPGSMRGTIEVIEAPPSDETAPRMSRLRIKPRRPSRRAAVHLRLSEAAFVVLSVRRAGKRRELRSASEFLRKGKRRIRFSVRGLKKGRYRAVLVAEDDVGNRSRRSVGFRIRR